jgi:lactate dehydrogenase-like 2-hydroxyacid dehydrogenase
MKIGYLGKQNSFALEMLKRLQFEHSHDDFFAWQPGEKAPSTELEVTIAFGKADSKEVEAQAKLGLIQMGSAGYEGVDVEGATKFGVWVGSAPTTKTGNGESVAELAVLLMLAASRRLNEDSHLHMAASKPGRRNGKGIGPFVVRLPALWDWGESEICSSKDFGDSG